jgi:tuftelin-interacting protein 11
MSLSTGTRNKEWVEKGLGKKMLMKLGWKEGEGLGANGLGITENLEIKKKAEQSGIGFKKNKEEDLSSVKQIQVFDEVLSSLNKEYDGPSKKKLKKTKDEEEEEEEVRRPSRRRRTYRKFIDAKDSSLYSKTDLKAILGGLDI